MVKLIYLRLKSIPFSTVLLHINSSCSKQKSNVKLKILLNIASYKKTKGTGGRHSFNQALA